MITVNGKLIERRDDITTADLLQKQGYDLQRIAVERNGSILPRDSYASVYVEDGDVYEIVSFVGGG